MTHAVLDDAFIDSLAISVCDINRAVALPPSCYTDREFFEFEKEAIFNREWLCVGRESWVKEPGDYFTTSHVGEPIIVARTREGELKAMSAVCQHRAALVAEGHGSVRSFMCPYHHWTYALDGRLVSAPDMERAEEFDCAAIRLPEIRLETWLGFIFINFDLDAAPLGPRLTGLTDALANYDLANADGASRGEALGAGWGQKYAWNWKVHFENSNDSYHANKLHKGFNEIMPTALASFPEMPEGSAGYYRDGPTLEKDAGFNPTDRAILPIFPKLTDKERGRVIFANIPPSFTLFARVDLVVFNIIHVQGPEEIATGSGWLVAPGVSKQPRFQERKQMTSSANPEVQRQDRHVDALVQTGLRSRYATRGRYSWQEGAQAIFNNWLVDRYRASWGKRKPG